MMATSKEKAAFAKRLRDLLPKDVKGGTSLSNKFNTLYKGRPVSPQTAHKWYTGLTIPKRDKLEVLAEWLKTDVHTLHYGPAPVVRPRLDSAGKYPPSRETIDLASKIELLSPKDRNFVEEFIERFYGDDGGQ